MEPSKLDAATDAVRAEAEEAHLHDRGATLSALADCARALKRIAKRAVTLPAEYERIEIDQARGPRIEFSGRLLADTSFETKGRDTLLLELEIWETQGGAMIAASYSTPVGREGREIAEATIVPASDDAQAMRFAVMNHFQWETRARSMAKKLGWSLRMDVE